MLYKKYCGDFRLLLYVYIAETVSVRTSARLAMQTMHVKVQADDKSESSESESEGYQTDVQV